MNSVTRSLFFVVLAVLLFSSGQVFANPEYWTDGGGTGLWNEDDNWLTYYTGNRLPQYYDFITFNSQTANMTIDMGGVTTNALQGMYINGNGNGYTIGSTPGDGTVVMVDGWGLSQQSNLIGNGEGTTFNSKLELQGYKLINNSSPDTQVTGVPGVNGYNNPLTFAGGITKDNGAGLFFTGVGDIVVSGALTDMQGSNITSDMARGSLVLSGTNSINANFQAGGGLVLDYRTNNTAKLGTGNNLAVGNGFTNWNGNVPANGGHIVIDANQSAETDVTFGSTTLNGSSSIVVNGASDGVTATVVNFGTINPGTYGAATDITTSGNVSLYTNSTNNGTYGAQVFIMGQYVTLDKTWYAQAGGNTLAQDGNGGYGSNSTPVLITPLVNDNGTAFNSIWQEFHVAADVSDVQTLTPDGSNNLGADTFRFTSANDPGGMDVNSAHTLDLGGGNLGMAYGGIMVTQAVTGDTTVRNGTIGPGIQGLSIINYSSGTLNISANIGSGYFGINGGGTVELSGNNEASTTNQLISVNDGKLIIGSTGALGVGNQLDLGSATAVVDLNGYSINIARLLSDINYTPGNAAAAAGLNANIENTRAGTISTLKISGTSAGGVDDANVSTVNVTGDTNLGQYFGGLNEVSGSIISLDIEKGTATNQVQFQLGTANPFGDASGSNVADLTGVQGPATNFTGAVIVGAGANLALTGYGNIETMGVTKIDGLMGPAGQQAANYGTTYLTGSGATTRGYGSWGFGVTSVGSAADTFTGNFGTASNGSNFVLDVGGTGALALANNYYGADVYVSQDSTLITPALANGQWANAIANGNVMLTGTSGNIDGNIRLSAGGTVTIAPSGAGQAISVSSTGNYIGNNNSGNLILDAGQNTSLTYTMGNTSSQAHFEFSYDNSFTLGVTQGLAVLGTTTQFLVQSNSAILAEAYQTNIPNNILGTSFYAQDDSAGSPKNATFIQISTTADPNTYSLTPYAYDAAHTNNVDAAGLNDIELVTAGTTYTYTQGGFDPILGLQIDKGGVLQNNGDLTFGNYNTGYSGIILNGGKILGNGVNFYRATSIYADLDGGEIQNLNVNGQDFTKNGPGTLLIDNIGGLNYTTINGGVLDVPSLGANGLIALNGGVLQTSGDISRTLGNGAGDVELGSGGFAGRGAIPGPMSIDLYDATGAENLVWGVGGTPYFLGELGVLQFNSSTSNQEIFFNDNINLGLQYAGANGQQALYSRVINVAAGAGDSGDRMLYQDEVLMTGVISASDPYVGLSKDGAGTMIMAGVNTYQGATMIAEGELVILDDSGLGTAPTAAYALNTAPGVQGAALTPGAIEINGGAALGSGFIGGDAVIDSHRQMLLASGTTGSNAAIVDVAGGASYGAYTTMSFGGVIADYVGEIGSLEKQGGGTFDYSGTSANTGFYAVTNGTLRVSGAGSINSASGIVINNESSDPNATAQFNYASTVGLTKAVSFGAGGGVFAYNSAAAYTGANSMTVTTGQTLAGAGNLGQTAVTIGAGGTITPGNINGQAGTATVGALTTGAVTLLNGGNYNFLIADVTGAAGTGYSTINASSVDLSGLTAPFNLNLETLAGNVPGAPANFNPLADYDFVLFSTGVADGITPETVVDLDALFDIHAEANNGTTGFDPAPDHWYIYESADSSTLYLHYSAVPEPGTWAMLLGGLGLLSFIRRFRCRKA